MTSAVVLGMVVALFPQGREQAKAIAVFSAVGAAGGALGTFLGGALTQAFGWHWIFLINLPIGVVALFAAVRVLADDRPDPGAGFARNADHAGAALITGALMLTVYVIVGSGDRAAGRTLLLSALALALLAGFVVRQARAARPLLRLGLFRSRLLSGANAVQILMIATMYGFQFIGALYLQRVLGYDELTTGLAFLAGARGDRGADGRSVGARGEPVRGVPGAAVGARADHRGDGAARPGARERGVPDGRPAADAAARRRVRGGDARADRAGHVGGAGGGRGARVGALQHHAGGWRFAGAGRAVGAGHAAGPTPCWARAPKWWRRRRRDISWRSGWRP